MNPQKNWEKKAVFILVGILAILLIVLLFLIGRKGAIVQPIQPGTDQDQGLPPTTTTSLSPRIAFSDYALNTELPASPPDSVALSDIKTSYTTGEALDMATKIGFNNAIVEDGVNMVLVTDKTGDQEAMLSFSKTTGGFVFVSETGYPSGAGGGAEAAARAFLTKMGIMDDTIDAYATYKRASSPGVTFVEFHRSWEKLGLPIINPVGVLNLDETERLVGGVSLGYIENSAPPDPDIAESSDGKAGKVRPNQFNTITVGVIDQDSSVLSVASNIKLFSQTKNRPGKETLKTAEEALAELKSGKTSFSLVKPTGEGVVDMNTVFPGGQAVSQNATIDEVLLTYLDEVGQKTQSTLYPHYLFKGTATLDSGYDVKFVQTVAAVKQINALGVFAQNSPPTVFPGQGNTLQYGTFNWLSPAPNPDQNLACAGLTQLFQLPNGGYIGWYPNTPPRTWYYVPPPGEVVDAARMQEVKKILRWEAAKTCKGSINDSTVCAFSAADFNLQTACYYVGAGSPFIYFYAKTPKDVKINLPKSVTYADPALSEENQWSFTASSDQTLTFSDGVTKQKLYYEYDRSVFKSALEPLKHSGQGFVVEKNNLDKSVDFISQKLGLTEEEEESLLVELTREANKLSGKVLKVGLLTRKIVDQVLTISVTPQPQTYHRLFFYVTSADSKELFQAPTLEKLTRDGDTVVELGVIGF